MTERRKKRRSCTYLRRFAKASIDVLSDVTRLSRVASRQIKENYNCPLRATLISKRNLFHEIKIDRGAVAITRVTRGKTDRSGLWVKRRKVARSVRTSQHGNATGFLGRSSDVRQRYTAAHSPANFPSTAFTGGVRLRKPTRKPEEAASTRVAARFVGTRPSGQK